MTKIEVYDYLNDEIAQECLTLARQGKSRIGFGAVLLKDGVIIGKDRNRHATAEDREMMRYVDYAIHAEQGSILDAIRHGYDVSGSVIYVIGIVLTGKNKGALTIRNKIEFGCRKCPHALKKYDIPVNIPYITGWVQLSPDEAMQTGNEFHGNGTWKKFTKGLVTI